MQETTSAQQRNQYEGQSRYLYVQDKTILVPVIFTDGNIAQLITKDSNGKLIEVDKAGKRPIVTNKISGTLMYISEVDINPTTNLLDLAVKSKKKLI